MEYTWYEVINSSDIIGQGDFIPKCPIVKPPSETFIDSDCEIEVELIDSIILSQSCDLLQEKIQIVLVCPYFDLETFKANLPDSEKSSKAIKKNIDNLRKGYLPGYHLLNKSPENGFEKHIVVDFRNVYGIHINNLKNIAQNLSARIRLLPPYREHLSQAFARYFMRVGLPQDIKIDEY